MSNYQPQNKDLVHQISIQKTRTYSFRGKFRIITLSLSFQATHYRSRSSTITSISIESLSRLHFLPSLSYTSSISSNFIVFSHSSMHINLFSSFFLLLPGIFVTRYLSILCLISISSHLYPIRLQSLLTLSCSLILSFT